MTIEATLESIDNSLKSLLQIALTGAFAKAEFAGAVAGVTSQVAEAAPATKTRAKKGDAAAPAASAFTLLVGDSEGTRYFVIDKHNTAARVLPGDVIPTMDGTVEVNGDVYEAKKAEFAKKSVTAVQTAAPAAESKPAATASTASSSAATVSFKQVVDALTVLSKDTRPGKGRDAIVAFVSKHGVAKVPGLEALGKNAELLAEVEALLAPDEAEDDVFA